MPKFRWSNFRFVIDRFRWSALVIFGAGAVVGFLAGLAF